MGKFQNWVETGVINEALQAKKIIDIIFKKGEGLARGPIVRKLLRYVKDEDKVADIELAVQHAYEEVLKKHKNDPDFKGKDGRALAYIDSKPSGNFADMMTDVSLMGPQRDKLRDLTQQIATKKIDKIIKEK